MHDGLAGANLALMLFRVIWLNQCGCVSVVRSRGLELVAEGWGMSGGPSGEKSVYLESIGSRRLGLFVSRS